MTAEPAQITDPAISQVAAAPRSTSLVRLILGHRGFLVLVDLALGVLAYFLAWFLRTSVPLPFTSGAFSLDRWMNVAHPWLVLVVTQVLFIYIFGLYDEMRAVRYRELVAYSMMVCLAQLAVVTSYLFLTGTATAGLSPDRLFPRSVIVLFSLTNFVGLMLWRVYVKSRLKRHNLRVVIVGERSDSTREIIREIEQNPWMGLKIVGTVLNHSSAADKSSGYPVLGSFDDIEEILSRGGIEEVILASEPTWKDRIVHSIGRLNPEASVKISILPSMYEMVIGQLRHVNIHDTPLISVRRHPNEPFQRVVKRVFDVVMSALLLVLLSPLLLVVTVLIRITSKGPAFYLQHRVGLGGRIFRTIKFRTMIQGAEEPGREEMATNDDPRVTPLGRLMRRRRIDELPQLVNVLKGDMSFVGPRPERPGFVKDFESTVPGYSQRLKIKPGITGLAQVRGFYHTSAQNKLMYDLAYIYNYSFSLDLLILLETLKVVVTRPGS